MGTPGPGTGQDGVDAADDGVPTGPTRRLGPATFTLPAGWEVVQQDEVWIDAAEPGGSGVPHPYTSMCLRRTADPGPLDCTLEMFHGEVPGHEGFQAYDPNGDWSWYRSTDAMACPDGADQGGEALDTVQPADGAWRRPSRTSAVGTGPLLHPLVGGLREVFSSAPRPGSCPNRSC